MLIYIVSAKDEESRSVTGAIAKKAKKNGAEIFNDNIQLAYRQQKSDLVQQIKGADAIVVVVSNEFLHSESALLEFMQIYEEQLKHKMFPIVLDDVDIESSSSRLNLVSYWEQKAKELEEQIRNLDALDHVEGLTKDLAAIRSVRQHISQLTSQLKDLHTFTTREHLKENFKSLFEAIEEQASS